MSTADRAVAKWLRHCFATGFHHGSAMTIALADAFHGKRLVDNADGDRELRALISKGWIKSTGYKPTTQQLFTGVGGGRCSADYPVTHGYEPDRAFEGEAEWFATEHDE